MDSVLIENLPVVYQTRVPPQLQSAQSTVKKYTLPPYDIDYFRDANADLVYFVIRGGGSDSLFELKHDDTVIFNGTDEYGFDMGNIVDIGDNDFQIEYKEFFNTGALRKCRNLKRLPPPEDFDTTTYLNLHQYKVKKYKMRFSKKNASVDRKWFLVIHTMTTEEYINEVVNDQSFTEDEEQTVDSRPRNYHCHQCIGDTPIMRERCRRITENAALTAYECAANDAYDRIGEYANNPSITAWHITIDACDYLIDYNNVLFSHDGEILGFAIPSDMDGTDGLDAMFTAVLFDSEGEQPLPPPKYSNSPPEYEQRP